MQELFEDCKRGQIQRVQCWITQKGKKQSRSPLSFLRHGNGTKQPASGWLCGLRQPSTSHTLLHLVALHGHAELARWLVQRDEQLVRARDRKGCMAAHLAAWKGHHPVLEVLLDADPGSLNEVDNAQQTALHLAAVNGHGQTVRLLLQRGADPRLRNARQENVLDIAVRTDKQNICRLLLIHCAELALQCASDCCLSSTQTAMSACLVTPIYPLHTAARLGHRDCLLALLEHGFDVNYLSREGTALHSAVHPGQCQIVEILLENGSDVCIRDSDGKTALEWLEAKLHSEAEKTGGATHIIDGKAKADTLLQSWNKCREMLLEHCKGRLPTTNGNGTAGKAGNNWKRLVPETKEERMLLVGQRERHQEQQQPVASPRTILPILVPERQQQQQGNGNRSRTISPAGSASRQSNHELSPSTAAPPPSASPPCPYQPLPTQEEQQRQQSEKITSSFTSSVPTTTNATSDNNGNTNNNYQNVPKSFYDNAPPTSAAAVKAEKRKWQHNCCASSSPPPNGKATIGVNDGKHNAEFLPTNDVINQRAVASPKQTNANRTNDNSDDEQVLLALLHNQLRLPTEFMDAGGSNRSNSSSMLLQSPCSTLEDDGRGASRGVANADDQQQQQMPSLPHSTAAAPNGKTTTAATSAALYQNAPLARAEEDGITTSAGSTQPNSPEHVPTTATAAEAIKTSINWREQKCHLKNQQDAEAEDNHDGDDDDDEEDGEIRCLPVDSCNSIATLAASSYCSSSSCSELPRISEFSPSPSANLAAAAANDDHQSALVRAAKNFLRGGGPTATAQQQQQSSQFPKQPAAAASANNNSKNKPPSFPLSAANLSSSSSSSIKVTTQQAHKLILPLQEQQHQQQHLQQEEQPIRIRCCRQQPTAMETAITTNGGSQRSKKMAEPEPEDGRNGNDVMDVGMGEGENAHRNRNDFDNRWKEIDEMLSAIQRDSFYAPASSSSAVDHQHKEHTGPKTGGKQQQQQQMPTTMPSKASLPLFVKHALPHSSSSLTDDGGGLASTPHTPNYSATMFPSSSSFSLVAMPTARFAASSPENGTDTNADDVNCAVVVVEPVQRVLSWLLNDVGLISSNNNRLEAVQIAQLLCHNGFDQVQFMKGSLNTKLMSEMGIERRMQLRICRHLNDRAQLHQQPEMVPNAATFKFVSDWLNSLLLLDHLEPFSRANLTSTADLIAANLTRGDLEKMGIVRLGHLARIMRSLELANKSLLLQQSHRSGNKKNLFTSPTTTANDGPNYSLASSSSSSTSPREMPTTNKQNHKSHHSHDNDTSIISNSSSLYEQQHHQKSRGGGDSSTTTTTSAASCSSSRAAMLSPQLDMGELRRKLVEGCVHYAAHYLGSTEISNVEGTEDCRRAMIAAKAKLGQQLSDVPHVIVEISVSGVNILDANKKAIFHQPINHIQVVCQDELDLNCFAYIFKDGNRHFSHVFCVLTAMIAKEIIVTLGEAFNLAYKLALQQQNTL